jgi:transposase-like protein
MVVGTLNRGGQVRAAVAPDRNRSTLQGQVRDNVAPGSTVYTDSLGAYTGLSGDFEHETVDHRRVRPGPGPHERHRELLEALEAWPPRHLCQR